MRRMESVLGLVFLHGCGGAPLLCASSGGDWNDCASVQSLCVNGEVQVIEGPSPAICEVGCTCPSEAPVWDEERGCLTEAACADGGGE